jgi:hypothetical protein
VCVCSLRYPSCNAHAPYCHLCPVRLYNIFPHYLINGTIFERKLLNTKCVLTSSTTFVWNISHSENNWTRSDEKCISVCFMWRYSLFLSDFNEPWNFSTSFRKVLRFQTSWKSVQWEQSCSMWTDRRTDMTNLIVCVTTPIKRVEENSGGSSSDN